MFIPNCLHIKKNVPILTPSFLLYFKTAVILHIATTLVIFFIHAANYMKPISAFFPKFIGQHTTYFKPIFISFRYINSFCLDNGNSFFDFLD